MKAETPPAQKKDFLWLHLRDLPYFRSILRAVEAEFYQDFDLPQPVLDLGCGNGHFATVTFDHKLDVGLDPWREPLLDAQHGGGYRTLVQADAGKMPFPDNYFASGLSNSVLEHIPHIDAVLAETGRVLRPGAPFLFCVPNPRYLSELDIPAKLKKIGLAGSGQAYTEWFKRMSRVQHADWPETSQARLERAGLRLDRWWHYFSPQALRALEWGHYWGAPTLLPHRLFGRWIVSPTHWNLALTERLVRRYVVPKADPEGTFYFLCSVQRKYSFKLSIIKIELSKR